MNTQKVRRGSLPAPIKYPFLFLVGGSAYYGIEILYRGRSHWSMAICGGLCLVAIYLENRLFSSMSIFLRAALCALTITLVEFVAGCILNLWLGWQIWSYHTLPLNLLGQIAPLFTFFWFLLSLPLCLFFTLLEKKIALKKN